MFDTRLEYKMVLRLAILCLAFTGTSVSRWAPRRCSGVRRETRKTKLRGLKPMHQRERRGKRTCLEPRRSQRTDAAPPRRYCGLYSSPHPNGRIVRPGRIQMAEGRRGITSRQWYDQKQLWQRALQLLRPHGGHRGSLTTEIDWTATWPDLRRARGLRDAKHT